MRNIKIDDVVWGRIAANGKFGETANDVLRRLLNLNGGEENGGSREPVASPSRRHAYGWKERRATVTMTQREESGELVFKFANGIERRFRLPSKTDKVAIRKLRDEAVAWARESGATDGQQGAVMRALTSRGYHVT